MEELKREVSERGLTVSTLPDKGRCLLSGRDFFPGDVILSEEPYISVPNKASNGSRCESCFIASNLKKCSACQVVWYCGSTCQKSDWKLHRVECRALSALEKDRRKSLTPSIRLMVKLYLRKKLEIEKVIPISITDNYNMIEALVSHISEVDEKQLVLYAQMANLVALILQLPDINIKEIAENFAKFACNAHTICDVELRPLGTGLYPIVSMINHSCSPNAVLIFEGKLAVIRAVQQIPKNTEVLISYIDTAGSTMTRQKTLKEQYFFTCSCTRCIKLGQFEDIQESATLEGYRCKNNACLGFLLRDSEDKEFICQLCGLTRNKEEIREIASEVKLLSDKASNLLSSGHKTEAADTYTMIEKLQLKICHPFSINLMRTRDDILKLLMEQQDWSEALKYCKLTIPAYERAYVGFHPLLGLQYYTCGKLQWLLGDATDAVKSLSKAFDILRITHGTNTPFVKELQMKLDEARFEEASH